MMKESEENKKNDYLIYENVKMKITMSKHHQSTSKVKLILSEK
jgi:hypothetical protein